MSECVVCGARTRHRVTLANMEEIVALCEGRCQRLFLHDPLAYLGAVMAAPAAVLPSPSWRRRRKSPMGA